MNTKSVTNGIEQTLIQNYFIKTKENIDINNITFYTKNEFQELLFNEEIYEIAHILKYNYENGIDNNVYIEKLKLKKIDLSFLNNLLKFMISRGIPQAILLQKEFNLNTSKIDIEFFIEGFLNGMNGLEDSDLIIDFINLYKNKDRLLLELTKKGKILLLFELVNYYGLEIRKITNKNIAKEVLNNFENDFNKYKLFEKIMIQGNYNWYEICGVLFDDFEFSYQILQNIFDLSEKEKDEFEILKQDNFFISYQSNIHKNIEGFEDINYEHILEFTFNDISGDDNYLGLDGKIKEIIVGLNVKNKYSIVFLDITGKKEQFNLGNSVELEMYNYGLLEKNIFYEHITECYGEYKLNLEKNNMDFTVLIFKENGDKDDTPDEENEDSLLVA